jgi:hypothetical protein
LVVPRATAVLRRTITCSRRANGIGLAEISWEHLFKDDIMEPAITHVVFVDKALTRPKFEVSKGDLGGIIGKAYPALPIDAIVFAMHTKSMQVYILPAHSHLEDGMEMGDRRGTGD